MIYSQKLADYSLEELEHIQKQFLKASVSHLLVDRAGYLSHVTNEELHKIKIAVAKLMLERTMGL